VGDSKSQDKPHWYQKAVIYQAHVKSFYDSNGDGIGDFPGLTLKLDYLADLGVTALWILPFYPSPQKDDGYDIADYTSVNPAYGTLDDFRKFLGEAHRRGIRVITELVLNHTSDQHPWFQKSRRAAPGTPERDFYVWSGTTDRYKEARIIFKDFEVSNWTWDPVANAYFWHRFYAHQPDLNFENPAVEKAMIGIIDFWLGLGVDGLRLDAVPYLYEEDGTNCENLPATHAALKRISEHIRPPPLVRSHAPGGGQPMAGGCGRLFRQGRRMPYGLQLPADAAHVHGAAHGGAFPHRRYPGADARDSRQLPMGAFSAQP